MATYSFGMTSTPLTGTITYNGSDADAQALLQWASAAYAGLVQSQATNSDFIGSISGTTLTVVSVTSGAVAAGQSLYGAGVAPGQYIASGSGSTWTVSVSQTVASTEIKGFAPAKVGKALADGTMQAWLQATQRANWDLNKSTVPQPPPMGWA